ncbi:MAG: NAD(P)H-dependent oxidoreductase subunit E, partial [Desulfobacterales bacterium]|nr:NAD(P)H-dependent oxidoreductase subunit E [Desulfobacterales bacterium]
LPEDALRMVARGTGSSLVDIYGVATFYKAFSLKAKGKHLISVCLGTACHVRAAPDIVDEFTQQLGISPGETTEDNEFTLETVNCLGACALGPIVNVDGHYFSNVTRSDVKKIIQKTRAGFEEDEIKSAPDVFPIETNTKEISTGH